MKKRVLRNFTKFTRKHLCQSLFFNKVAGLRPATLLKKRPWYRRFTVNFAKFLRTPSLQNTSGLLLLKKDCVVYNHLFLYNPSIHYKAKDFFSLKHEYILTHIQNKNQV